MSIVAKLMKHCIKNLIERNKFLIFVGSSKPQLYMHTCSYIQSQKPSIFWTAKRNPTFSHNIVTKLQINCKKLTRNPSRNLNRNNLQCRSSFFSPFWINQFISLKGHFMNRHTKDCFLKEQKMSIRTRIQKEP